MRLNPPPCVFCSFTTSLPSPEDSPKVTQPLKGSFLPHLSHHAHLGWNAPTPQSRIAILDAQTHARHGMQYGMANKFNQDIHFKHAAISTRRA